MWVVPGPVGAERVPVQFIKSIHLVTIHASHMHVLYARWRFAGMSAAQAARGGDAGGAQGIR